MRSDIAFFINDVYASIKSFDVCWTMGLQDIRQRYRRSVIGPFWLTLSMGIMVLTLGLLYGRLFKIPLDTYLPFLTAGLIVWNLLSSLITEGSTAFIDAAGYIKQLKLPFATFVFRVIWRNLIIFFHNIVIFVIVIAIFSPSPFSLHSLLMFPALLLIVLNGIWVAMAIGFLSTRYRDIPQIVASLMQPIFFFTPIIWQPKLLQGRQYFIEGNPFYHYVDLLRAPMLGRVPEYSTWLIVIGLTVLGWGITSLIVAATYRRVAYWV